jgi:kynurenine formamidase
MQSKSFSSLLVLLGMLAAAFWLLGKGLPTNSGRRTNRESSASATLTSGDLLTGARIIDLTHPFDEQTVPWPTEVGFRLERGFDGVTDGGWYYRANRFSMAEHSGTHLDAPSHFAKDGESADEVPLARLIGPAVVVDITAESVKNPDFLVTVAVLQDWERKQQRSLEDKIVLLHTGWPRYWPDRERYLGTAETGKEAVAKLHFPGLDPAAADWLARNRRIRAIGIDTASIDAGQSKTFGSHVALCEHEIPAFENLMNLEQLPSDGFTVIALPMKIRSGSGGPLRAIAITPNATGAK